LQSDFTHKDCRCNYDGMMGGAKMIPQEMQDMFVKEEGL